jgi:polyisoprenoid-binding protein YceI
MASPASSLSAFPYPPDGLHPTRRAAANDKIDGTLPWDGDSLLRVLSSETVARLGIDTYLRKRCLALCPGLLAVLLSAATTNAQEVVFQLDPAQSRVQFTVAATFHDVHGTFQLKGGTIHFNPASGEASGSLIVDSISGKSGNERRDRRMHRQMLEDQKYPEIVFTPQHVTGKLASQGTSEMELQGLMSLHGQQHPMTITVPVQVSQNQASAEIHFIVPYLKWGLKNPSTFILRVSENVSVDVHAVGHLSGSSVAAAHDPAKP